MHRIAKDYLWRWKWPYVIGFVVHCVAMILAWQKKDYFMPVGVLGGSAFLLMFEFMRGGGARTLLSLPVTSKDVARAWRFVALEFPSALFLVALGISMLLSWLFEPTWLLNFERFLILGLFQTLLLGTVFFGLTGIPVAPADQRGVKDQIRGAFYGLLWGFSIPGTFLLSELMPSGFGDFTHWHWLVGGCLLGMTVAGWLRAEDLALKRVQQLGRATPSTASTTPSPPESGFGGVPYLCFIFARRTGLMGVAIILLNWFGMQFFIGRGESGLDTNFTATQVSFVAPIMAMITALVMFAQLRSFRALPLSKAQITSLLVLCPMVFALIFGLIVTGLHLVLFGGPVIWSHFFVSQISAGGMILVVPALLWFGLSIKTFAVVVLIFPGMQVLQEFRGLGDHLGQIVCWAPALFAAISFFATMRILDSSRPWRANALRFPNFKRI